VIDSLSERARRELDAHIGAIVDERLAQTRPVESDWMTLDAAAELLGTSAHGLRQRLARRTWLDESDVVRDGRRILVRRSALLDRLDRRAPISGTVCPHTEKPGRALTPPARTKEL